MKKIISVNPSRNYEINGSIIASTEADIAQKVAQAQAAKTAWRDLGLSKRIELLWQVHRQIQHHKTELALLSSKEMGAPLSLSEATVDFSLDYLAWYLEYAPQYLAPEISHQDTYSISTVYYEPRGIVAAICPWNYPVSNFIWSCAANLVVGNTVIFKHAPECVLTGKLLEEIMVKANLPQGVFAEIYGDVIEGEILLAESIDLICFTGSSKTGKHIYQVAANKFIPAILELGGSAPGIVFADADIDSTVDSIMYQRFSNSGQTCDGLKRLLVHTNQYDQIIDALTKKIASLQIGDALDPHTEMGPLVAQRQVDLLEAQLHDAIIKGAKILIGGNKPPHLQGAYYLPTILTNITTDMRLWQEEVFGPVLPIITFNSEEEAIKLANDTCYGLGAYLYSNDIQHMQSIATKLATGMVSINNANYVVPANPFGGYKQSGMGREHGKYGLRELCQIKVVTHYE